jgi:hypothetical protein
MCLIIYIGPGSDFLLLKELYNVTGSDNSLVFLDHLKKRFPDAMNLFIELDIATILTDKKFDGRFVNNTSIYLYIIVCYLYHCLLSISLLVIYIIFNLLVYIYIYIYISIYLSI